MCMTNHDTATVTLPLEYWDLIIDDLKSFPGRDQLIDQVNEAKAAIELGVMNNAT